MQVGRKKKLHGAPAPVVVTKLTQQHRCPWITRKVRLGVAFKESADTLLSTGGMCFH